MKKYIFSFIFISALVLTWFIWSSDQRTIKSILNVVSLPSGTKILDHASFAWTDYREEYLISFSGSYEKLLAGREFASCESKANSIEASAGLKSHEPVNLKYCYQAGDWETSEGFVRVSLNEKRSHAVIVYDQD